jgi:hypothetical protein
MRTLLRKPVDDVVACLGHLADTRRPFVAMCFMLVALIATWFLYVPVHELLHVLGCVATGGSVTRLEIAPQYGGALLAHWLPFVVSGGEYAGRLSGFDTRGSDLIYLATVFAPFLLSIVLGVPLLRACAAKWRPGRFGMGVVVGLAPFYNLIGDYYEMGSIITTRALTMLRGGGPVTLIGIRSDDLFKLVGQLCLRPAELGLHGPGAIVAAAVLVGVSLSVGVALALTTYALGDLVAGMAMGRRTAREHSALR